MAEKEVAQLEDAEYEVNPLFDSKASALPRREAFAIDQSLFPKYVDPKLGWVEVNDKCTCDGFTFVAKPDKMNIISPRGLADGEYMVFAEYIGKRYTTQAVDKEKVVAYGLIDNKCNINIVSIANISYFIKKIHGLDVTTPEYKLGLSLTFKYNTPVNKVYWGAADLVSEHGYRDGTKIRILPPDRINALYIRMLTNADLKQWYDYFNEKYFDNKLTNACTVEWNETEYSYTHCFLSDGSDDNTPIVDYKVDSAHIFISRKFLVAVPEVFYEVLLHQMIHALGTQIEHSSYNKYFAQEVERVNALDKRLLVRSLDDFQDPYHGKWVQGASHFTYTTAHSDIHSCKLYCSCGNQLFSLMNGTYSCDSCGKTVVYKGGEA